MIINSDNVKKINWEEQRFDSYEFIGFSYEGGHIDSEFKDCTFSNLDWYWGLFNMSSFVGCTFKNCTFRGTAFSGCNFESCNFIDCVFTTDNLNSKCDFNDSKTINCVVTNCKGFNIEQAA